MNILRIFFEGLILVFPVLFAGVIFVFILDKDWFKSLRQPIDFNKNWRNKRILGSNKTWLGPIVMIFTSALASILAWEVLHFLSPTDWSVPSIGFFALLYFLVGAAYSLGELPNSFVKRQGGIPPGKIPNDSRKTLVIFTDLIDGVLVATLVLAMLLQLPIWQSLAVIFWGTCFHYLVHVFMIKRGLKSS